MRLSLSPDLKRLRDEGYEVRVTEAGHLVISRVPYVNELGEVAYGQLVSTLNIKGDVVEYNGDHVAFFVGGVPHNRDKQPLSKLIHQPNLNQQLEADLVAAVGMSSKPAPNYDDYHHKMTTYVGMIMTHAQSIDPSVTAITHPALEDDDPSGPFEYPDSASSRARITVVSDKLRLTKVVIVGLGGTGSYVLDLIAKTPIGEIHLYDGDFVYTHNAFRAPGAAPLDVLRGKPKKVQYLFDTYSKMKRNIVPHPVYLDASNIEELRNADFVFLTMEGGDTKRLIVEKLYEFKVPFIDVGIGVNLVGDKLQGAVLTITRTPPDDARTPERHEIAYDTNEDEDIYDLNIQIADLNALNAALAVIRWKKLFGFYGDLEDEHYSAYTIDGNDIVNEDLP
jgi:hypothetical protein